MKNETKQTAMKLYTEEHLKLFYQLGKFDGIARRETDVEEEIKNHLPIELPSDEEIVNKALEIKWSNTLFKDGAKFVIDKIQGG
jgi:hypothetical protein